MSYTLSPALEAKLAVVRMWSCPGFVRYLDDCPRSGQTWTGKAEGHVEGKAEGQGKAEALLDVLALRSVAVDDATRARILGEQDLARLKRWLTRAMTCATAAELFGEP